MSKNRMSEKNFYNMLTVVLWMLGSFGIWEIVYELSHMVGAIVSGDPGYALREVLRMLPITLTTVVFLFAGIFLHNAYIAKDLEERARNWKIMGVFMIVVCAVVFIYVPVGLLTGRYLSIVEGNPTPLFPLDTMIGAVIWALCGVGAIKNSAHVKENGSVLPYAQCVFGGVPRVIGRIFCVLAYFVATTACAGFIFGIFIQDWSHGNVIFNILVLLMYLIPFGYFVLYRFGYTDVENDKKAGYITKWSLISLATAVVVLVLYMATLQLHPEAPNYNSYGIMPVDYTAKVNVFMLVYGANNILVPVFGLLYGLIRKKKL